MPRGTAARPRPRGRCPRCEAEKQPGLSMGRDLGGAGKVRGFWGTPQSCRVTRESGPWGPAPAFRSHLYLETAQGPSQMSGALLTCWRREPFPSPHVPGEDTGVEEVSECPRPRSREGQGSLKACSAPDSRGGRWGCQSPLSGPQFPHKEKGEECVCVEGSTRS